MGDAALGEGTIRGEAFADAFRPLFALAYRVAYKMLVPARTSPTLGADMLHVWLAGESDNPFAADMTPADFRCTLPA